MCSRNNFVNDEFDEIEVNNIYVNNLERYKQKFAKNQERIRCYGINPQVKR